VAAATKEHVGKGWIMVFLFQKQNCNFVLSWNIRILPRVINNLRCDTRHPCHCRTL